MLAFFPGVLYNHFCVEGKRFLGYPVNRIDQQHMRC